MIQCERGLGRLTVFACGRRWNIANNEVKVAQSERNHTNAIRNSPCRDCEFGEPRSVESLKRESPIFSRETLQNFTCNHCGLVFTRVWLGRGQKPSVCNPCKPSHRRSL